MHCLLSLPNQGALLTSCDHCWGVLTHFNHIAFTLYISRVTCVVTANHINVIQSQCMHITILDVLTNPSGLNIQARPLNCNSLGSVKISSNLYKKT